MYQSFWWFCMPPTKQRRAQGIESRRRLIEATAELLGDGGYSAMSVDGIAKRAGVVKSALYWHFGSKRGLLLAALEHHIDTWTDEVARSVAEESHPYGRLEAFLRYIRDVIVARPFSRRLIFSLLMERAHADEDIRALIARMFRELRQALVDGFALAVPVTPQLEGFCDRLVCELDGLFLGFQADPDVARLDANLAHLQRWIPRRLATEVLGA